MKVKAQWETFAREMASNNGDRIKAYKTAYPHKELSDEAARVSASRLLKRPEILNLIATEKNQLVTTVKDIVTKKLANERTRKALDLADKLEILYMIAYGKIKIPYFDKDGVKRYRRPDATERMKAIELDNEITGTGWRPPDNQGGGNTITNNIVQRVTIFKTKRTTGKEQIFINPESVE